jgi:NTE family protein
LRKRQVIGSFVGKERQGAYWGIRSDITKYELTDVLDCPPHKTIKLANVKTRLKRIDSTWQKKLINWGYAICDTAIRRHGPEGVAKPAGFPYPESGVG